MGVQNARNRPKQDSGNNSPEPEGNERRSHRKSPSSASNCSSSSSSVVHEKVRNLTFESRWLSIVFIGLIDSRCRIKAITGTKPSRWWKVQAKGTRDATEAEELVGLLVGAPVVKCLARIASRPATATKMSVANPARRKRKTTPILR